MTAIEIATATDAQDLYAKLITFLKTKAALVSASEEWTEVWDHASGDEAGIVLRGPGLSATDQIYIGLKLTESAPGDSWAVDVYGMTGVIQTATELTGHVNVSPPVRFCLDIGTMDYWFAASGRCFKAVVKISTVFESMYAGFFLPYADPTQYPYPMFIGAMAKTTQADVLTTWRDVTTRHAAFYGAGYGTNFSPGAYVLSPEGNWYNVVTQGNQGNADHPVALAPKCFGPDLTNNDELWPINDTFDSSGVRDLGYTTFTARMAACFDGSFAMLPFTLMYIYNLQPQYYGILDGVYYVEGLGNSSEDVVTVSTVDHLVVQNAFRTTTDQYAAFKLE